MTHTAAYYDSVEHDAVTAQGLIRQQRKLLEMQMQHINDLNARLAEQIRLRSETVELLVRANERIEELEADLGINRQPVPYALEPKQAKSCKTCQHYSREKQQSPCYLCSDDLDHWQAVSYTIPRAGCECGACRAARERGEVEL